MPIRLIFVLIFAVSQCFAQQPLPQKIKNPWLPEQLLFAGEPVPLHIPEVKERLERELIINCYKHSSTLMMLKNIPRYKNKMTAILKQEGIPEDFFFLAVIESELNPYAMSGKAWGFWQFTDATAKEYKLESNDYVEQRFDPVASTLAASKYFKKAKDKLGNWTLAAASYNSGIPIMDTVIKQQMVDSYYDLYLTPETHRYIFRAVAIKIISENPTRYGFELEEKDYYKPIETRTVAVDKTIPDLVEFAKTYNISFNTLKYLNPWIRFDPKQDHPEDLNKDPSKRRRIYKSKYKFEVGEYKVYYFEVPKN